MLVLALFVGYKLAFVDLIALKMSKCLCNTIIHVTFSLIINE